MSALAIALVLISALFHALRSLFTKESGDKQIFLWLYSIFALLFFSPLFFYFLYRVGITHPVAYAWCFGSGFIHFIYWLFLTQFLQKRGSVPCISHHALITGFGSGNRRPVSWRAGIHSGNLRDFTGDRRRLYY